MQPYKFFSIIALVLCNLPSTLSQIDVLGANTLGGAIDTTRLGLGAGSGLDGAVLGLDTGAGFGPGVDVGNGLGAGTGLGVGVSLGVGSGLGLEGAGLNVGLGGSGGLGGLTTTIQFVQVITIGNIVIIDTTTLTLMSRQLRMTVGTMGLLVQQIATINVQNSIQQQLIILARANRVTVITVMRVAQIVLIRLPSTMSTTIVIIFQTIASLGNTGLNTGLNGINRGLTGLNTGLGLGGATTIVIVQPAVQRLVLVAPTLGLTQTQVIRVMQNTLSNVGGASLGGQIALGGQVGLGAIGDGIEFGATSGLGLTKREDLTNGSETMSATQADAPLIDVSVPTVATPVVAAASLDEEGASKMDATSQPPEDVTHLATTSSSTSESMHTTAMQISLVDALSTITQNASTIATMPSADFMAAVNSLTAVNGISMHNLANLASNTIDEMILNSMTGTLLDAFNRVMEFASGAMENAPGSVTMDPMEALTKAANAVDIPPAPAPAPRPEVAEAASNSAAKIAPVVPTVRVSAAMSSASTLIAANSIAAEPMLSSTTSPVATPSTAILFKTSTSSMMASVVPFAPIMSTKVPSSTSTAAKVLVSLFGLASLLFI